MIKCIVADDEKTIRFGLEKLLSVSDLKIHVCKTAANGNEAIAAIQEFLPQLVLIDITMPGKTGLEVIEKAKEFVPECKFIIISGHDDFEFARRAVQLGAFDYILKPINRENLLGIVHKAVDQIEQQHEKMGLPVTNQVESNASIAKKALIYINEHFSESEISLANLAEQFHISQSYLTRIIKKEINMSFSEYLTDLRMKKAIYLLENDENIMVGQIAELVGFSSQHYFSRAFKSYTGISPLEFRQKNHQA